MNPQKVDKSVKDPNVNAEDSVRAKEQKLDASIQR